MYEVLGLFVLLLVGIMTGGPASAPRRKPVASMATTLKSCVSALSGVFCISFVTNLLMLTGPLFMLQIYDRVLTSRSIPTLTALLALVAVFAPLFIVVIFGLGVRIQREQHDDGHRSIRHWVRAQGREP